MSVNMNLMNQELLAQMRKMAQETLPAAKMEATENSKANSFSTMLSQAVNKINALEQDAIAKKASFEKGDPNTSVVEVMLAGQKSAVAFEALKNSRNMIIRAYNSIIRMPI